MPRPNMPQACWGLSVSDVIKYGSGKFRNGKYRKQTSGRRDARNDDEPERMARRTGKVKEREMMDPKHYTNTNTNTKLTLSIEGGLG